MKKILLVGAGYNYSEINPILKNLKNNEKFKIDGILDDNKKLYKKNYKGIPFYVGLENAPKFKNHYFVFAISSYKYSHLREKIFQKMKVSKKRFPNIIHSSVIFEDNVTIGYGNIIYPHTIICSNSKIEDFCHLTYSTILAHNVKIGSFTLIGSRSSILNNTRLSKNVFVGANVTIGENLNINSNSTILFGSVVIRNCDSNKTYFGNPAELVKL